MPVLPLNCELTEDERIFIETVRAIRSGERLTYDSNFILEERHTPAENKRYPCWCGAKNCCGTMLGRKR